MHSGLLALGGLRKGAGFEDLDWKGSGCSLELGDSGLTAAGSRRWCVHWKCPACS